MLLVFDAPTRFSDTFEQRIQYLQENIHSMSSDITEQYIGDSPHLKVVKPERVLSKQHIMEKMQYVREGLIFRKPGSKYMDPDSFFKLVVRK